MSRQTSVADVHVPGDLCRKGKGRVAVSRNECHTGTLKQTSENPRDFPMVDEVY